MTYIFDKVTMLGVLRINCGKSKKKAKRPVRDCHSNTDKPLSSIKNYYHWHLHCKNPMVHSQFWYYLIHQQHLTNLFLPSPRYSLFYKDGLLTNHILLLSLVVPCLELSYWLGAAQKKVLDSLLFCHDIPFLDDLMQPCGFKCHLRQHLPVQISLLNSKLILVYLTAFLTSAFGHPTEIPKVTWPSPQSCSHTVFPHINCSSQNPSLFLTPFFLSHPHLFSQEILITLSSICI